MSLSTVSSSAFSKDLSIFCCSNARWNRPKGNGRLWEDLSAPTKVSTMQPSGYWPNLPVSKMFTWSKSTPSEPSGRDPGERVISVVYYALINIDEYDREAVHQHNAYWVNIDEVPPLIFDHEEMVVLARERMKQKAAREPIGFNLLPKLFTLTRLQNLYEAIYGEAIDKRNFRKRVADMDYIEKTDKIDKESSKRGASLYKFNANAYNRTHTKFKL